MNHSFQNTEFQSEDNMNWRCADMAAFCACCGAEITLKAEACSVCGTPRHGMLPHDLLPNPDASADTSPSPDEADHDRLDEPA